MLSQMCMPAISDMLWLRDNLPYINEAFGTDFHERTEAVRYVKSYESDGALMKDMAFDAFVLLHERGDACVIIDRFAIFDRGLYEKEMMKTVPHGASHHRFYDTTVFA